MNREEGKNGPIARREQLQGRYLVFGHRLDNSGEMNDPELFADFGGEEGRDAPKGGRKFDADHLTLIRHAFEK